MKNVDFLSREKSIFTSTVVWIGFVNNTFDQHFVYFEMLCFLDNNLISKQIMTDS